jgi:hypothetical protein
MVTLMYEPILLQMIPDIREHVPKWYEPLLEKGWVWNDADSKLVRIGLWGVIVAIENDMGAFWLWKYVKPGDEPTLWAKENTLADCLAAAEKLVWKGVAP